MGSAWDTLTSGGKDKPKPRINPLNGQPMDPPQKQSVFDTLTAPLRARSKLLDALSGPKKGS